MPDSAHIAARAPVLPLLTATQALRMLAASVLVLCAPFAAVLAQQAPPQTADALALPPISTEPRVLEPFVATYQVFNGGRQLGNATLQVVHGGGPTWRVDLALKGGGLMRLTGLNLQQSTVFESEDGTYRPLSQALVKRVLFSNKKTSGIYDWNKATARWSGDVKKTRAGPVALRAGDMSGLLINLAVVRDAQPGQILRYRFVDDGRARDHAYRVAPQTETVQVGDLSYDAMRVERQQAGSEQTVIWVAAGVPTPIRILQREDGQDATDLRLIEYTGA